MFQIYFYIFFQVLHNGPPSWLNFQVKSAIQQILRLNVRIILLRFYTRQDYYIAFSNRILCNGL